MSQEIVVIRHGKSVQTPGNFDTGDPELHADGHVQARQLSGYLAEHVELDVLITSPAQRALDTAKIIAGAIGAEIVVRANVHEFRWGDWEGGKISSKFTPEEEKRAAEENWQYRANPHAETMLEAHDRIAAELADVQRQFPDKRIAIVGHGFAARSYLGVELQLSRQESREQLTFGNCEALAYDPAARHYPTRLFIPSSS